MLTFNWRFGLAYVGVMLLVSGVAHLLRMRDFQAAVFDHNVLSRRWARPICWIVCVLEAAAGCLALGLLMVNRPTLTLTVFFMSAMLGAAFIHYLRGLLANPVAPPTCGCSPFAAPLTTVSLAPAGTLLVASVMGLFGRTLATSVMAVDPLPTLLASWMGGVCALIALLLPATVYVELE